MGSASLRFLLTLSVALKLVRFVVPEWSEGVDEPYSAFLFLRQISVFAV